MTAADHDGGIARMRISDADRDRVASALADALAQGRLTTTEHAERLDAVYASKTTADLVPLVTDLPGAAAALPQTARHDLPLPARQDEPTSRNRSWMVSIFSGTRKRGAWQVPSEIASVNVFGGCDLDLRDAVLPSREVNIRIICVFGGADIRIPPQMHVIDSGFSIFGSRDVPAGNELAVQPDSPVLRVHGICVFGGINIVRKSGSGGTRDQAYPNDFRATRREFRDQIRQARSDLRRERRSGRRR